MSLLAPSGVLDDGIRAATAIEIVVTHAAKEDIVVGFTIQRVVIGTAIEVIVTGAAI